MITIDVSHSLAAVDHSSFSAKKLDLVEVPSFDTHAVDLPSIQKMAKNYMRYKNIVVIGNGGSINNFGAFSLALGSKKKVFLLNTVEPDTIAAIKKECTKKDTVVVPVSKAGDTVSVIETLLCFSGYQVVALTTMRGTLGELTKKMKWDFVLMPDDVGGRFAGRTACALFGCALLGYDIKKINKGFVGMYERCRPSMPSSENPAKILALGLHSLYEKGYHEIFMPVYSTPISGFNQLIVQLLHESCGKQGKGHTIYAALAPESQHHTNQRFFGGRKDVLGLFVRQEKYTQTVKIAVPASVKNVMLKDMDLGRLNGFDLSKAMEFEYFGTQCDATEQNIPNITIAVKSVDEHSLGEYLGLWQYTTVYLATLFGVDPYDQPQVENSKKISYALTKEYLL